MCHNLSQFNLVKNYFEMFSSRHDFKCGFYYISDRAATGLCSGPDAPVTAATDREELVRSDRPRAGPLRRVTLLHRPAAEDRDGQKSRQGLPPLRLQP